MFFLPTPGQNPLPRFVPQPDGSMHLIYDIEMRDETGELGDYEITQIVPPGMFTVEKKGERP